MLGQTPKQMSMQVGGIASHKSMVLKLDQYILKPFGTTVTAEEFRKKKQQQQEQDTLSTPQDDTAKGGTDEDVTKTFRGVREMAFYEALEFADSLSYSHEDVKYKLEMLIRDKYKLYTLSGVASLIWSCRYPCTGHPIRKKTNVNKMYYSIDAIMLLMAYFTGDSAVNRSMESYIVAWHMLIKEMHALKKLSNLTSPYFGVVDSEALGQQQQPHQHQSPLQQSTMVMQRPHLLLLNLTAQFRKPNIIDIKMGTQTYEPLAPYNKQVREISKYPQQQEFGFRIVGMGVHLPSGEYKHWDKNYGVSLTTMDEVTNALSTFFRCNNNEAVVAKVVNDLQQHIGNTLSVVIDKLNQIKDWFEVDNPSLAFYASSILIVYEGDYIQGDDEKIMSSNNEEPVVKIIDFAHVCRQTGTDMGYITGVCNLIDIVEGLRSKSF